MKIPIFGTLKDAYDKYILMDNRMSAIEKRIEALEQSTKNTSPSKFSCKSCDTGTYRATNEKRMFRTMAVGTIWKCDACGHIPGELQSQSLDNA